MESFQENLCRDMKNKIVYGIIDLGKSTFVRSYKLLPEKMNCSLLRVFYLGPSSISFLQGLSNPHDLAVSKDGSEVYVVEIGPNKIWKFQLGECYKTC